MARSLLTVLKAAINHVSLDGEIPLLLLEFEHSTIDTLYVVHNNEDITSNSIIYKARPFAVQLLDERLGELPTTQMTYYDVDLQITTIMRSVSVEPPGVTVRGRLIRASDPDTDQITPWRWHVLDFAWNDKRVVTLELGPRVVRRTAFPAHRFSPDKFPGKFGGTIR